MIDKTKQIVLVSVASLALLAFVSTMGYSLGKQSVTNETRAAIKQEAKKLQDEQTKKRKPVSYLKRALRRFSVTTSPRNNLAKTTSVSSPI